MGCGCCKNEAGVDDMESFLVSINGDTTPEQTIVGAGLITVNTVSPGITTISGASGTVTNMTAPQMFVSPVVEVAGTLELTYSGQPIIITENANASNLDERTNTNAGSSNEVGYSAINDFGTNFDFAMSGSNNTNRGVIRCAATALGFDLNAQGSSKYIRLMTNSTERGRVSDTGLNNMAIGVTTPQTANATDLTLTVTPLSVTNGGTSARAKPACFDNLSPLTGNKGALIVWNGSSNVDFPTSSANDGYYLQSDSSQTDGVLWAPIIAPSNTSVAFQATTSSVQNIVTATSTQVTWDNIVLDTNLGWVTADEWYNVPLASDYSISATVVFSTSFTGYDNIISIVKNSASTPVILLEADCYHQSVTGLGSTSINGVFALLENDTIQINIYQNTGSSLTLNGNTAITTFNIYSIGGVISTTGLPYVTSVGLSTTTSTTPATVLAVDAGSTPVTSSGTLKISYSGTPLPVLYGGTGETTKQLAINNLSQSFAEGDIMYNSDGTNIQPLARGTTGQVLTSTSGSIAWGTVTEPVTTTSINYTILNNSSQTVITNSTVNQTTNLYSTTNAGTTVNITNNNTNNSTTTIAPPAGQTINGSSSGYVLQPGQSATLTQDGTGNWVTTGTGVSLTSQVSGVISNSINISSTYTITATTNLNITVTVTSLEVDVTLPSASQVIGQIIGIKLVNAATSGSDILIPVKLLCGGSDIMKSSPVTNYAILFTNGETLSVQSDGFGNWLTLSQNVPTVSYACTTTQVQSAGTLYCLFANIAPSSTPTISYTGSPPSTMTASNWTRTNAKPGVINFSYTWTNIFQNGVTGPFGVVYGRTGTPGGSNLSFSLPLDVINSPYITELCPFGAETGTSLFAAGNPAEANGAYLPGNYGNIGIDTFAYTGWPGIGAPTTTTASAPAGYIYWKNFTFGIGGSYGLTGFQTFR